MLDKVLTAKVNPITKDQITEIASQWNLTPSTIVRAALYLFVEDYFDRYSDSPKIIPMLQYAKKNGGRLAMDDLVEVTFTAEPDGKQQPTVSAPPELLEELEGKALLLALHADSKYRRQKIAAMQARLAEKLAKKPPEGEA